MSTIDIVQKLWNLCNVLRDDGITYHQYVTELTYILFLKMLDETGEENTLKADVLKAYQKSLEQYARKKGKAVEQLPKKKRNPESLCFTTTLGNTSPLWKALS